MTAGTTFHEYDLFNNRVRTIDPRGNYQRMSYDAMGQMIGRRFYDGTAGTNATVRSRRRSEATRASLLIERETAGLTDRRRSCW